jgi:hypothetical protein
MYDVDEVVQRRSLLDIQTVSKYHVIVEIIKTIEKIRTFTENSIIIDNNSISLIYDEYFRVSQESRLNSCNNEHIVVTIK